MFFSCAKISAAQAPDGPPPTTATLYFMSRAEVDCGTLAIRLPTNEEGVKATAVAVRKANVAMENFMVACVDSSFVELVAFTYK